MRSFTVQDRTKPERAVNLWKPADLLRLGVRVITRDGDPEEIVGAHLRLREARNLAAAIEQMCDEIEEKEQCRDAEQDQK